MVWGLSQNRCQENALMLKLVCSTPLFFICFEKKARPTTNSSHKVTIGKIQTTQLNSVKVAPIQRLFNQNSRLESLSINSSLSVKLKKLGTSKQNTRIVL